MARPMAPMTAKIENFIRMEARGESANAILKTCFGLDQETSDPKELNKAYQQMWRWRHRPDAKAIWEDELAATVRRRVPGAVKRLNLQIDNQNDWVANKASNDVITLAKALGVVKSDETTVKVQIEGLPDLGSPDEE